MQTSFSLLHLQQTRSSASPYPENEDQQEERAAIWLSSWNFLTENVFRWKKRKGGVVDHTKAGAVLILREG